MKSKIIGLLLIICFLSGWSYKRTQVEVNIPAWFPAVEYPKGNELTAARYALGKRLFFDPILSRNNTISCSSCHLPELAFSDSIAFSLGVEKRIGVRNAPSLANVAYHPYFNKDGGVPTLEMQILVPIQDHNEMDFNIVQVADRMLKDSTYYRMSQEAYGRYPDAYVITRAIACYERTLISGNSKYDKYINSDTTVLSALEKKGKAIFFGKRGQCASCHSGFNFTNYRFENNGLYLQYTDSGRMRITHKEVDRDRFKVPSLRNIEHTAPYMHDGSIRTLNDVIEHYSVGIKAHPNKNAQLSPRHFTPKEKVALLAFLKTLSDLQFVAVSPASISK